MGYIWAIYTIFIYLLTYYFRFRSGTRVPVVLPGGYPGNKLPGYGSPIHKPSVGVPDGRKTLTIKEN